MTAGEEIVLSLSAGSGGGARGEGLIGFEGHGSGGDRQTTTRLLDGEFLRPRFQPGLRIIDRVLAGGGDQVVPILSVCSILVISVAWAAEVSAAV